MIPMRPIRRHPRWVWVHWVVYNVPPDTKSLPENAGKAGLPQGNLVGLNDFKKAAYGGPCPPIGRHRYFRKLYALDITLDLKSATKAQIERSMQGHVLANAELIGRIKRSGSATDLDPGSTNTGTAASESLVIRKNPDADVPRCNADSKRENDPQPNRVGQQIPTAQFGIRCRIQFQLIQMLRVTAI
jgi:hypothetical protein